MSIPTARKKLAVAHQEVRDEVEKEKEQKEKERLAKIEKHNQEVEARRAIQYPKRLREVMRGALGLESDPPENTGQDTKS